MKKSNFFLKDPSLDFFLKTYFLFLTIPIILSDIFAYSLLFVSQDLLVNGSFSLLLFAGVLGLVGYVLGYLVVVVVVALFNKKLMSGGRVKKFNKFPRLTLFLLAFIFYLITMFFVNYILKIF